ARRFEWIDVAIENRKVQQADIYAEFLKEPQSDVERDFQSALNVYARNANIKAAPPAAKPVTHKPCIIFHLGATKTGSTALQHLMEDNRPALLREGIWYPEVGLFWQPTRPHKQAGHADFARAAVRNEESLRNYIETGLALMEGRIH